MSKQISLGDKLRRIFSFEKYDSGFFEELEDSLLEGDLGVGITTEVIAEIKQTLQKERSPGRSVLLEGAKRVLRSHLKTCLVQPEKDKLSFFLVLGVNGVGKTTTIAKLADYFRRTCGSENILFSAADTFRAAAADQLALHGERLGIKVICQNPGADPGAVIFDTLESAKSKGVEVVLADTAGRMHTKANLIKELQKIDKIIKGKIGSYHALLVIDATTGQNGLRQAEVFNEALPINSIVLSKYDSASKGGIALAISRSLGIPFSFLGTGEKIGSLVPFDAEIFINGLLGIE